MTTEKEILEYPTPAQALQDILETRLPKAKVKWLETGGHLFHETDSNPVLAFIAELTRP